MKLPLEQLGKHLKGPLAKLYVVSGDEHLLCQEAADGIRQAALQQGFNERQVFNADTAFDWSQLSYASNSLSLFADKRLLELRLANTKLGDRGAEALLDYLAQGAEDSLLLIRLPKLDSTTQKSKWCKALISDANAVVMQVWPVEARQLPDWVRQRLAQAGLSVTPEALELICGRVEGNLLAAAQEIEKLKLLADNEQIDQTKAEALVTESARFDLFGLLDTALAGAAEHALRMLHGLRGEGVEPTLILWGLARELRLLNELSRLRAQGMAFAQAIDQQRPPIREKRKPLLRKAVEKQRTRYWSALLLDAQRIDEQIKGQRSGSPWTGLDRLVLGLAGRPVAS